MWRLFKMTPLQGEPARESSRTLYSISLLQHGPGKVSQTNSAWTFWKNDKRKVPDAKCCQDGHRFSPEASLSIQWRYPKLLRLQTDHPLVPVIGREVEGQQRLGPLTCLLRSSDSLMLPFHHCKYILCFAFNSDWLPHESNKLLSCMVQTNGWVLLPAQSHGAIHHRTQLDSSQKESVDRIGW